ncbi:MAG: c-type cytochrome domain-containing protein [Pelolinea sp.]|nr:c-type cytochrome domain-containing protein [Pelolinea sp.]
MKTKLLLIIISGLILTACSPAFVKTNTPVVVENTAAAAGTAPAQVPAAAEVSFSKEIWPVLEKYALAAHGGKGGVFLESYEDIMKYVVPGSPEESMLYKRLTADGVAQMPPSGPLPTETIKLFYDWIKQGAKNN